MESVNDIDQCPVKVPPFHTKLSKLLGLMDPNYIKGNWFLVFGVFFFFCCFIPFPFFQPQVEVGRASSLPISLLSLQRSPIEPAQGYSITNEINRTYWGWERVTTFSSHVSSEKI